MTRLKSSDVEHIAARLEEYDQKLKAASGRSLKGVACHAWDVSEDRITEMLSTASATVIPVTAGLGIIAHFCESVAAILKHLGMKAIVSRKTDISGLATAYESGCNCVMMADENRFVGINLKNRKVSDNSEATGRVYAAALDLMAGRVENCDVLVMGCGPVGAAAVQRFLELGARVVLYDTNSRAAKILKERFSEYSNNECIRVAENLSSALINIPYILEATTSRNSIPDSLIGDHTLVAAPGVPLGISADGCRKLENRLVHDSLELGVAAMVVDLVIHQNQGD